MRTGTLGRGGASSMIRWGRVGCSGVQWGVVGCGLLGAVGGGAVEVGLIDRRFEAQQNLSSQQQLTATRHACVCNAPRTTAAGGRRQGRPAGRRGGALPVCGPGRSPGGRHGRDIPRRCVAFSFTFSRVCCLGFCGAPWVESGFFSFGQRRLHVRVSAALNGSSWMSDTRQLKLN